MIQPALKTDSPNRTQTMRFYPFVFTSKERDEKTGYGYFGARYMDHELMTSFLSVDRYASKYPSISPYAYCAWNPVRLTDPSGDTIVISNNSERIVYQAGMSYNGNDSFIGKTIGYLNDMAETPEGEVVLNELINCPQTYSYISKAPSSGKSYLDEETLDLYMGLADNHDFAHETFHAYQHKYGMRGKTATREVGAKLFEAMMCEANPQWGHLYSSYLSGCPGSDGEGGYGNSMVTLFEEGFNSKDYLIACQKFLTQVPSATFYQRQKYKVGEIMQNPPIKKILSIHISKKSNR